MMNLAALDVLKHNWGFVYFHNEMEGLVQDHSGWPDGPAPDLVSADVPLESVPDGKHEVTVYGRKAILFVWTSGVRDVIVGSKNPSKEEIEQAKKEKKYLGDLFFHTRPEPARHGLVVLEDTESYDYARQKFEGKVSML